MQHGNHGAKWVFAVAIFAILISGSMVLGSNMGFKFNMPIIQRTAGVEQGKNHVALPYITPYPDRQCLCDQLGLPGGAQLSEFNAVLGNEDSFFCGALAGGCGTGSLASDFLTPGKALFIRTTVAVGSGIVVGAHDVALSIRLECLTLTPPQGDNWISPPYHTTAAVAQDICDEVAGNANGGKIENFDATFGDVGTYFCGTGVGNFAVNPGDGLNIVLDNSATGVSCAAGGGAGFEDWTPSHF